MKKHNLHMIWNWSLEKLRVVTPKSLLLLLFLLSAITTLVLFLAADHFGVEPDRAVLLNHGSIRHLGNVTSDETKPYAEAVRWPRRLLIIWCKGSEKFRFANYISATSAIKAIKPSSVIFAHEEYPLKNLQTYDTWLQDLEHSFPFWEKRKLGSRDGVCADGHLAETSDIKAYMLRNRFYGTIFISGGVVLSEDILKTLGVDRNIEAYSKGTGFVYVPNKDKVDSEVLRINCPVMKHTAGSNRFNSSCFILEKKNLIPEDFMYVQSGIADTLRELTYGSKGLPLPRKDPRSLAPNIAHYVWLGGGAMHFTFFLSVLSALYIGRIETVYIHGDHEPKGGYWDELKEKAGTRVYYMPWPNPGKVYQQDIPTIQHKADVIKSKVMWDFGGILMDPDICFVRPPDLETRSYEAVLSPDTYLTILNMGISISKPHSEFARLWLDSEREFVDESWLWNCGVQTYKLWEKNPSMAKISPKLQLFCIKGECYPLWVDRRAYMDSKADLMPLAKDWRNQTLSIHFVFPDPWENFMDTAFKQGGFVGEYGRVILRASGLLGETEGLVP